MAVLLVLLALMLFLIFYFRKGIYNIWNFYRKVDKLPKSKCNFFLGHIWDMGLFVPWNKIIEKTATILKRSPPTFAAWVGPFVALAVIRPQQLEIVLGSHKHIKKAFQYRFFEPWLGTGLLTSSGAKWHYRRKMLTPAFHFTILENYIPIFEEKSRILVEKLQKEVGSKKFDIMPYITMCALDIICETIMGVEINAQDLGEDLEYVEAVCNITEEIMTRGVSPWLYPDFIFYLSPGGRRFKKYVKILHEFSNKVIQQRKQSYSTGSKNYECSEDYLGKRKKIAFLDLLLMYSENGTKLSDEDIREEVDTFMFEGHDTTAAAMSWTLQMLASHKDVQKKAQEEIDKILVDLNRPVTSKDLNEMNYLRRVIKETLRLYPSVPLIARSTEEDFEMEGILVPGGIVVGMSMYFTHRDPEHFPGPEKFNPDNFLPERTVARYPYAYTPFSAGPRNCIGQKFAMLMMETIISSILLHYELHATGEIPIPVPNTILRPENGVQIRITPRSSFN